MHEHARTATRRRGHRRLAALCVALTGMLLVSFVASPSNASSTTSGWLASTVGPDGSVIDPYGSDPSIDWTVNVALSLAATGAPSEALDRSMAYIRSHAQTYITDGSSDPAGHLSWLMLLVAALGEDPTDFGEDHLDLVTALQDRLGVEETGLFGTVDIYTSATTQSLAILALLAAGAEVPPAAIDWLLSQQCSGPVGQSGAWQGHRSESAPGVLVDCLATSSAAYERADAATTSFAVMALAALRAGHGAAAGIDEAITSALAWLRSMQATSGAAVGGFGQYVGDSADPNSTAVAILALIAAGVDPTTWTVPGGDPRSSLDSWIIGAGPDSGALSSPYSAGAADLFATYQGFWGIAGMPFPMHSLVEPVTTTLPGDPSAEVVPPAFTG